jgi:uncharacterized membrane protein
VNEESFKTIIEGVSRAIDAAGVLVVVVGLVFATALFALAVLGPRSDDNAYGQFRQRVGKTILLGLEFLVAADIIRTVAVAPTFRGVGVLAIIVVIRTFLSFTIEVELEGRWPWQKGRARQQAQSDSARPPDGKTS